MDSVLRWRELAAGKFGKEGYEALETAETNALLERASRLLRRADGEG